MRAKPRHIHRYHGHISYSFAASNQQRLYSFVIVPILLIIAAFFALAWFGDNGIAQQPDINFRMVALALLLTSARLFLAYLIACLLALPIALLIVSRPWVEKLLLPLFDILESVPVLAFFPVIIITFIHYGLDNWAAIFILVITMTWSLVFSLVSGLGSIPQDILSVAQVFRLSHWQRLAKVILPAAFPYVVTGSILAWASGWNIIIVAEVLHTYIPGGSLSHDLFGLGSLLVYTASAGQRHNFVLVLSVLVAAVGLLNLFVWQRLLHYAEKFKFE